MRGKKNRGKMYVEEWKPTWSDQRLGSATGGELLCGRCRVRRSCRDAGRWQLLRIAVARRRALQRSKRGVCSVRSRRGKRTGDKCNCVELQLLLRAKNKRLEAQTGGRGPAGMTVSMNQQAWAIFLLVAADGCLYMGVSKFCCAAGRGRGCWK